MRLIDVDKLIQEFEKSKTFEGDEYTEGINTGISWCIEDSASAPTVEAISVEWLLERAKSCTTDYADCLHYAVEAWQTEQKYMVNGQWKFPKGMEKENETN